MLNVLELSVGFADAENFRRKENRDLFSRLFVKTEALEKLADPGVSFLIGEKGTGKTAYAAYYSLFSYRDARAELKYIRETEYRKFLSLRRDKHLSLSDFVQIWKVIICLLLAQQIVDHDASLVGRFIKLRNLKEAIDSFYENAFAPEIANALQMIERSEISAKLLVERAQLGGTLAQEVRGTRSIFQVNLMRIQRAFEDALRSLKLPRSEILFIDGIDVRPNTVPYDEYLDCIKGLANAVWEINNDFLANIKDSPGRLRVVLLIRPDIFDSLELQNQNTKVTSNSVLLDWRTNYEVHRSSKLFEVIDRLLAAQQNPQPSLGEAWDYYFPFDSPTVMASFSHPSSFVGFLRLSFYRPRDLIRMLEVLQEQVRAEQPAGKAAFAFADTEKSEVRNKYANYLLGEIKDHLLFYYSRNDYELFLKFFEFLRGKKKFSYSEYVQAYDLLVGYAHKSRHKLPVFMTTSDGFLQFLYDLNVICYFEHAEDGQQFIRWCFRERTYANMSPKIKTHSEYEIHYGIARALNIGVALKDKAPRDRRASDKRTAGRGKYRRK